VILAGDIGGTKTLLALVDAERGPARPVVQARYVSEDHPSLEAMVARFLRDHGVAGREPRGASFAVAGPVSGGRVQPTNLPWEELSEAGLASSLGLDWVTLLNDLQAVALGITASSDAGFVTLAAGRPVAGAPMAVIAPGTGLGEAFLTWDGGGEVGEWAAHPSEGGHTDFAPGDELELELLRHLQGRLGHVSYEQVCSGVGVPNLYDFLAWLEPGEEPPAAAAALATAEDRTRAIVDLGTGASPVSARCQAVVSLFVRILGAEAGNLVLTVLATGGLYITGGLAKAVRNELAAGPFLERMRAKGRLSHLVEEVPVTLVTSPAALTGAAVAGLRHR